MGKSERTKVIQKFGIINNRNNIFRNIDSDSEGQCSDESIKNLRRPKYGGSESNTD